MTKIESALQEVAHASALLQAAKKKKAAKKKAPAKKKASHMAKKKKASHMAEEEDVLAPAEHMKKRRTKTKTKASTSVSAFSKLNLKKLNRVISRGVITPDELSLAVWEALRSQRVNVRLADKIVEVLRQAVAEEDTIDIMARRNF